MLRVRDIMTTDLLAFDPEVSIRDAMATLAARHVSGAPVIAAGKVVGVVSTTDLIAFAAELQDERVEPQSPDEVGPENRWDRAEESPGAFFHQLWGEGEHEVNEQFQAGDSGISGLDEHVVADVMNTTIRALPPETPAEGAASFMREAGIHRVLVMEGDHLLGLVSTSDIARAVADHKLTSREWVFGPGTAFDQRGWPGRPRSS